MIKLCDLVIGSFPVTQYFGQNPLNYSFIKDINGESVKGHPGVDIATPSDTIGLNPFPETDTVVVYDTGYDTGRGNWIRIWSKNQQCVVEYQHCVSKSVQKGDTLFFQQEVVRTGATGNVTGPHLHVGFYLTDINGVRLNRTNGFDGFLNILNEDIVVWDIKNPSVPAHGPTAPITPVNPDTSGMVSITAVTHTQLVTNSDRYASIAKYFGIVDDINTVDPQRIIDKIQAIKQELEDNIKEKNRIAIELDTTHKQIKLAEDRITEIQKASELEISIIKKSMPDIDAIRTHYTDSYNELMGKYNTALENVKTLKQKILELESTMEEIKDQKPPADTVISNKPTLVKTKQGFLIQLPFKVISSVFDALQRIIIIHW